MVPKSSQRAISSLTEKRLSRLVFGYLTVTQNLILAKSGSEIKEVYQTSANEQQGYLNARLIARAIGSSAELKKRPLDYGQHLQSLT